MRPTSHSRAKNLCSHWLDRNLDCGSSRKGSRWRRVEARVFPDAGHEASSYVDEATWYAVIAPFLSTLPDGS
jgi:hypothetical protein